MIDRGCRGLQRGLDAGAGHGDEVHGVVEGLHGEHVLVGDVAHREARADAAVVGEGDEGVVPGGGVGVTQEITFKVKGIFQRSSYVEDEPFKIIWIGNRWTHSYKDDILSYMT